MIDKILLLLWIGYVVFLIILTIISLCGFIFSVYLSYKPVNVQNEILENIKNKVNNFFK